MIELSADLAILQPEYLMWNKGHHFFKILGRCLGPKFLSSELEGGPFVKDPS